MTPSNAAIALIKRFEGLSLTAYRDQRGIWTIGYGCTGFNVKEGTVWTLEQAESELRARVESFGREITSAVGLKVNQNQFDALCSLVYNIGPSRFRGSTLVKLINERNYPLAAQEFPKWNHVNGKVDKGLTTRRLSEQALFLKG